MRRLAVFWMLAGGAVAAHAQDPDPAPTDPKPAPERKPDEKPPAADAKAKAAAIAIQAQAVQGNRRAMRMWGRALVRGGAVKRDVKAGEHWLRRAYEYNDRAARAELWALPEHDGAGAAYRVGVAHQEAGREFEAVAQWQHAAATYLSRDSALALLRYFAQRTMRSRAHVIDYAVKAIAGGRTRDVVDILNNADMGERHVVMSTLAYAGREGTKQGVFPKGFDALRAHKEAAAQGDLDALVALGVYANKIDPDRGLLYLWSAALRGDRHAMAYLSARFYTGTKAMRADRVAAAQWRERAAQAGHVDAQFIVALQDLSTLEKRQAMLPVAARAAADGHGTARFYLSVACSGNKAFGMPKDSKKAAALARRGALQHDSLSMRAYASMLKNGKGTPVDLERAWHYYGRAAALGNDAALKVIQARAAKNDPWAVFHWGRLMVRGEGVALDVKRGLAFIQRAGAAGLPQAQQWWERFAR